MATEPHELQAMQSPAGDEQPQSRDGSCDRESRSGSAPVDPSTPGAAAPIAPAGEGAAPVDPRVAALASDREAGAGPDLAELDRELAARLRRGDRSALAALYDRYGGVVLALLMRIVRSQAEAEDLLQEVFLQAWRRAPEYDPRRGSFSAWLFTIARNRALDVVRSPRHKQALQRSSEPATPEQRQSDEPPASEASPEETLALKRRAQAVRAALADLSPVQREAIELAYYSGLSHSEIASQTGEPLGTIKSRINQAAAKLRAALGGVGSRS